MLNNELIALQLSPFNCRPSIACVSYNRYITDITCSLDIFVALHPPAAHLLLPMVPSGQPAFPLFVALGHTYNRVLPAMMASGSGQDGVDDDGEAKNGGVTEMAVALGKCRVALLRLMARLLRARYVQRAHVHLQRICVVCMITVKCGSEWGEWGE
jgi:hypothetical protein